MVRLSATLLVLTVTSCRRATAFTTPLARFSLRPAGTTASISAPPALRNARYAHLGKTLQMSAAAAGDLVSVNWSCTTAEGQALPEEAQVFDQGRVRLVLGAGGAIPSSIAIVPSQC